MSKISRALGVVVGLGFAATGASASVINVYDGATFAGSLQCGAVADTDVCEGLLSDLSWSDTQADLFDVTPPNSNNEFNFINAQAGNAYVFADYSKDDSPSNPFTTDSLYILFKLGGGPGNQFLVRNTSGGALQFSFNSQPGYGLSHTAEVGKVEMNVVPLPAAGVLLVGALGGLGLLGRRRGQKA